MTIQELRATLAHNMTTFIFQGLDAFPKIRMLIFIVVLVAYCIIICGNIIIVVIIWGDHSLHTPMYIFLFHLSIVDVASTSVTLPQLLNMLLMQYDLITINECMTQMYFFLSLAGTEINLLTIMAYDRYAAICHPLHYIRLMSFKQMAGFLVMAWIIGFIDPIAHVLLISKMSFCRSHLIRHFFCDVSPMLQISCNDISEVETLTYIEGTLLAFTALPLTLVSYSLIISTILKIKSSEGQSKAFSTCTSHLTCVSIFYGILICLHMRPTSSFSPNKDMFFALVYIVLVPILNPFIYSLKNKDFQKVVAKLKRNCVGRRKKISISI